MQSLCPTSGVLINASTSKDSFLFFFYFLFRLNFFDEIAEISSYRKKRATFYWVLF